MDLEILLCNIVSFRFFFLGHDNMQRFFNVVEESPVYLISDAQPLSYSVVEGRGIAAG